MAHSQINANRKQLEKFARKNNIKITPLDNNIDLIVNLSEKYISNGKFPDKAIDVFDEVCARTNICINKFDKFMCDCNLNIKRIIDDKNKAIINHDYDKARSLKEEQFTRYKGYIKPIRIFT